MNKVRILEDREEGSDRHELEEVKEYFEEEFSRWMSTYREEMGRASLEETEKAHRKLKRLAPLRKTTEDMAPETTTYRASSWLVEEVYDYVTELEEETICFVAGQKLGGGSYTLEKLLKLDHEIQTRARAKGEIRSTSRALSEIDTHGSSFSAHFHSHPFRGREGTKPSGKDLSFQESLENGGHVCIGGIFSRDGYLRFFSSERDFEVSVTGKGVKRLEGGLFQIET